jgi:archaellin
MVTAAMLAIVPLGVKYTVQRKGKAVTRQALTGP